jgi:two-component system, NarL family, response regulator DevR
MLVHQGRTDGSQRELARPIRSGRVSRAVRLLVADSQALIRLGLRAMLAGEPGLSIGGEVGTLAEAVTRTRQVRPDLLLLDYHLLKRSDARACRLLCRENPKTRILIMTEDRGPAVRRHAVKAGAHGFVCKDSCRAELLQAIRLVAAGDSNFDSMAVRQAPIVLSREDLRNHRSGLSLLSPQERRILPFVAEGKTNREIALKLALAERTVKNYIANMYKKLHIGRRVQAAALYLQAQTCRVL